MAFDKNQYHQHCKQVIDRYIQDSTRLEHFNFDVDLIEAYQYDFDVALTVHLSSRISSYRRIGTVQANEYTLVYLNYHHYQNALKDHARAELNRPNALSDIEYHVLTSPYGTLNQAIDAHQYDKNICHTYECDTCNGHGRVNCSSCRGSGKSSCGYCHGSGQTQKSRQRHDSYNNQYHTEYYYESCHYCWGSGKTNCSPCHGSGKVQCNTCEGTAYITEVSTIYTVATPKYSLIFQQEDVPKYIPDALYQAGLHNLAQHGNVSLHMHEQYPDILAMQFAYSASMNFARSQSNIKDYHITWILYGDQPQILESSNVLEVLLQKDLDDLIYRGKYLPRSLPFSGFMNTKTIQKFTESEINQIMLEKQCEGKTIPQVREHLQRSVSEEYIAQSANALKKIILSTQRWSLLKWMILCVVIGYVLYTSQAITEFHNAQQYNYPPKVFAFGDHAFKSFSIFFDNLIGMSKYIGLKLLITFYIIFFIRRFWLRSWLKRAGQVRFYRWSLYFDFAVRRRLMPAIFAVLLTFAALYFAPITLDANHKVWGLIPSDMVLEYSLIIQNLLSYLNYLKFF